MRIDIVTVLPALLESTFSHSSLQRARNKGLVEIQVHNLRDYSGNRHKSVDDYPYGGGAGMVMSIVPFANCIDHLQKDRTYEEIIYMSPDGQLLDQPLANSLSLKKDLLILCGHYKGIDRSEEHTSELQSLMRISYAVFCLNKKNL